MQIFDHSGLSNVRLPSLVRWGSGVFGIKIDSMVKFLWSPLEGSTALWWSFSLVSRITRQGATKCNVNPKKDT